MTVLDRAHVEGGAPVLVDAALGDPVGQGRGTRLRAPAAGRTRR
ncbi:hypothetical protein ACFWZR_17185 [Streptomyces sp. NPDC059017]